MDDWAGEAVQKVVDAWCDEGTHPAFHRAAQARLARQWPVLYSSIQELVKESVVRQVSPLDDWAGDTVYAYGASGEGYDDGNGNVTSAVRDADHAPDKCGLCGAENWQEYGPHHSEECMRHATGPESHRDAVDPGHYKFPGGVEVRHISAHLTSFGGQAVQYVCRATRLDGRNKGNPVEDIDKAITLLQWERDRLTEKGVVI